MIDLHYVPYIFIYRLYILFYFSAASFVQCWIALIALENLNQLPYCTICAESRDKEMTGPVFYT
jgi:hypothetical protein